MNILFINPSTSRYTRSVSVPLGLLSIASYLESKGHNVRIYDRTVSKEKLQSVIDSFKPDVSGISLVSYKSIEDVLGISEELKKQNIPVFIGGPLASVLTELVLDCKTVEAVSLGEGEETWLEIAEKYDYTKESLKNIGGLAFKNSEGNVIYTEQRPFVDLSLLPPLNWKLINVPQYYQSSYGCDKMLYLYSAKGCPFSCTFCYNKDFHKCTYRKRPLEVLLEEIRFLVENYGMDGVYFADELWCKNRKELQEVCDALKSLELDFVWGCQTRIGLFDETDFSYMYNSGCRWIFFGIESGSPRILKEINKRIDYDKIQGTFESCKKAGLACIGSFIAGFPGETCDDLKLTVKLIKSLDTSLINMNYLALIPGSEIYKSLIEEGKYKEVETLRDFGKKNPLDKMEYNYSEIPDIDIKVVRAYYMWKSFTATDIPGTQKFSFAKKVITDALKSVKTGDIISFAFSTAIAGFEFLKVFYYSHFFPEVKKKYDLKK